VAGGCERDGRFGLSDLEIFAVATAWFAAARANSSGQATEEE
jgi:hypothetical protein